MEFYNSGFFARDDLFLYSVIPDNWKFNIKKKSGTTDYVALDVLSYIVNWFRPIKMEDNDKILINQKFKGKGPIIPISHFCSRIDATPKEIGKAIRTLKKYKLISTEQGFDIQTEKYKNQVFGINVKKILEITYGILDVPMCNEEFSWENTKTDFYKKNRERKLKEPIPERIEENRIKFRSEGLDYLLDDPREDNSGENYAELNKIIHEINSDSEVKNIGKFTYIGGRAVSLLGTEPLTPEGKQTIYNNNICSFSYEKEPMGLSVPSGIYSKEYMDKLVSGSLDTSPPEEYLASPSGTRTTSTQNEKSKDIRREKRKALKQMHKINSNLSIPETQKIKQDYTPPRYMNNVVDYWLENIVNHKKSTKAFKNGCDTVKKAMKGFLFREDITPDYDKYFGRRFTEDEILLAMERFKLAKFADDYAPVSKTWLKSINLQTFFYNPMSQFEKSLFIKYLNNEPQKIIQNLDPDPEITEAICRIFNDDMGTEYPEERFFRATEEILYIIDYARKLRMEDPEIDLIYEVFNAFYKAFGEPGVGTFTLQTFNNTKLYEGVVLPYFQKNIFP